MTKRICIHVLDYNEVAYEHMYLTKKNLHICFDYKEYAYMILTKKDLHTCLITNSLHASLD